MRTKLAQSVSLRSRAAVSLLAAALLVLAGMAILPQLAIAADKKPDTTKKDDPPKSEKDQAIDQQAKAWTAFYSGKYEDAIKLCDPLLKSQDSAQEAVHCQARACWAIGTQKSCARAMQIWGKFPKPVIIGVITERLSISKALAAIADKNDKSATQTLEAAMTDGIRDTCTAEAAIELAKLYVKAHKFDDAQKALTFAKSMLEKQVKATEMPAAKAAPFLAVINKAIDHLTYDKDAGREPFENAQALQRDKKFADAAKIYQQVVKDFADTDYAPRSQVSLGYCMVGLKEPGRAVEHWKKFISALPAGPWRAQAYIAIIDLYCEELLDLNEAGKQAALARDSMDSAMTDEKASPSWKAAEADIHLRLGIISLFQGKGQNAAASFEKALAAAGDNAQLKQGLAMLIETAKAGKAVIPADVGGAGTTDATSQPAGATASLTGLKPGDKPALALAIGTIYNATGRYEAAMAIFDRVLGGQIKGATPAQLAYATFGNGAALQGQNKIDQAKATYLASLKAFPSGTWHDETLYRVAMIIQDEAQKSQPATPGGNKSRPNAIAKAGTAARPTGAGKAGPTAGSDTPSQPPKALTPEEREQREKAERDSKAQLVKAQSEALPYWQELIKRYSSTGADGKTIAKSPRIEPALYNAGLLIYDQADVADPADAAKSEVAWKQAFAALKTFTDACPDSPFAGDAYVCQIDIALERMFELKKADSVEDLGEQWIKQYEGAAPVVKAAAAPWMAFTQAPGEATIKFFVYDLRLRGILTAYLSEQFEKAKDNLAKAGPVEPSDGRIDPEKVHKVGLFFLQKAILNKTPVWKPEVMSVARTDQQRTALKLADLYLKVIRPDKAQYIYERMIANDPAFAPQQPTLEVYARIQLARCYQYDRSKHMKALDVLQTLYTPELTNEPQIAEGLVWLGTLTHNFTQDPRKSMPHFQYVMKHFPDSPFAERAAYFYCLDAVATKDEATATDACKSFLAKYPKSTWANHVASLLNNEVAKLSAQGKDNK